MAIQTREQEVLEALRAIQDPDLHRDIVSLGYVRNLRVDASGAVSLDVDFATPSGALRDQVRSDVRLAIARLAWVTDARVQITASTPVSRGDVTNPSPLLPRVKNIIAVASGKGGVGKSTTSVNLALALAESGARVGLLDGDIYGPNLPLMLGLKEKPQVTGEQGRIDPVLRHGIKLMSIGFFMDESKPVIWRGPMVHGALQQFLRDVDWGDLDYLVVDLPPGTGDAPLSLSQLIPLSGVVIVTTPQDVALQDVGKGMAMFKQLEVPLLGVVENMSYFECPGCHERHELFGKGGGERIARQFNTTFLGQVPLQPNVRSGGDEGAPIVVADPQSPAAQGFMRVAGAVVRQLQALANQPSGGFIPLGGLTIKK